MREKRTYGKHELYLEGDTLFSVPHGLMTLAEAQTFNAIAAETIGKYGYCMILGDLKDASGIEPEARRFSAQWAVGKPVLGIAMFNESLIVHALFRLLLKAMNLLRKQPVPFSIFKTEQEARDWLAQLRQQHQREPKRAAGADSAGLK